MGPLPRSPGCRPHADAGAPQGDMTNRPRLQYVGGSLSNLRLYDSPVRAMLCTINVDLAQQSVNPRSRQRGPYVLGGVSWAALAHAQGSADTKPPQLRVGCAVPLHGGAPCVSASRRSARVASCPSGQPIGQALWEQMPNPRTDRITHSDRSAPLSSNAIRRRARRSGRSFGGHGGHMRAGPFDRVTPPR